MLFGPHETNLANGRAISERHAAYYRQRAIGGAGLIVIEEASVHPTDWPYERCPSAAEASPGWREVAAACVDSDALVLAALGHSGGQGSSAFSQRELWAPSDEPEVNSGEVPKIMEIEDIVEVVDAFGAATRSAVDAGLDGVEINAGQNSLLRQFLSGLTNRRGDVYGADRLLFTREVLQATRAAMGPDGILGLRLSCDEMAPWAGVTPEAAADVAQELAPLIDYLVVVRGSIFTLAETRPTGHHGAGFNIDLAATIRSAVDGKVPVFAQGSIVDPNRAEEALQGGRCDGVEMTRAQIADPDVVAQVAEGRLPRPCVLCNQRCAVRDNRNPIITCIAEPAAGHETTDQSAPGHAEPDRPGRRTARPEPRLLVIGAGPAGLEAARVGARLDLDVVVVEKSDEPGGLLNTIARAPGHERFGLLAEWLVDDATAAGVEFRLGDIATAEFVSEWAGPVIHATGSRAAKLEFPADEGARILTPISALMADDEEVDRLVPSSVAVWDPIGNSVGVAVAERFAGAGRHVTFITPDPVVGTLLSLTGDLAGCNVRLQQAGVSIERRSILRRFGLGVVSIEHRFSEVNTDVAVDALVDCSARLPDDTLYWASGGVGTRVGDAVAARTVAEAVREGRRAVMALTSPAVSTERPGSTPAAIR